jgi:hypothetical protein
MATALEANVTSNPIATTPAMSSFFPWDRTINVTMPATIRVLIVIAQYFMHPKAPADDSEKVLFTSIWVSGLNV